MKKIIVIGCLLTILATCLVSFAQDPGQANAEAKAKAKAQKMQIEKVQGEKEFTFNVTADGGVGSYTFIATDNMFGGPLVKGAPYSAQAVTENIQTLSDGNRIVRKNTTAIYRDGEGRTRNDQTFGQIGPYAAAGDPPKTFFINDPVAGVNFVLEPNSKTARKMFMPIHDGAMFERKIAPNGDVQEETIVGPRKRQGPPAEGLRIGPPPEALKESNHLFVTSGHDGQINVHSAGKSENFKTEALGTQTIEGVSAEGTRTTLIIPAGEIGNELPINIVTETWFSPELKVMVLRKHSDPRNGEMIYRLTNINRAEPDHSLFEVPADYTIKEAVSPMMKMKLDKELVNEKMKLKEKNDQ